MANERHLQILRQGVEVWNSWRASNVGVRPDLDDADLSNAHLSGANLNYIHAYGVNLARANLESADLRRAFLGDANLSWANLSQANLSGAFLLGAIIGETNLCQANLSRANLTDAYLCGANLRDAILSSASLDGADLSEIDAKGAQLCDADLERARLVRSNLEMANLSGCRVFGVSTWALRLQGATQSDLLISERHEPAITVDNLEVAQFIYLLLNNEKIREVITTISSKAVLILGRFTPERKIVLDAMRNEIRRLNMLPIVFDFEKPTTRDLTETITTLAHLASFVIADITDAKSIPQELQAIVPDLPSVPVRPIIKAGDSTYAMFEHFRRYPWVLPVFEYEDTTKLIAVLREQVIEPAVALAKELRR